jgi:hypothetical protein
MPKAEEKKLDSIDLLVEHTYLFRGFERELLAEYLDGLTVEKLYSNRPVFTAFRPEYSLEHLYAIIQGGPIIVRSTPLDRIIGITYAGGCFGMRNIPVGYGMVARSFPSSIEAYKMTDVVKIPVSCLQRLYRERENFQSRYNLLFELREKFQYHLLNCSTYPPQAVAALLRAVVYQERELSEGRASHQKSLNEPPSFDLPVDIIARASQLNHRTVEQVLKGMQKVKLIALKEDETGERMLVLDPEEVYSATRDKVSWWPLK